MLLLRILDDLRRRVLVHRRVLGSLCAAGAVWMVVSAVAAPPPAPVPVWTASHALPSGAVLARDDLARSRYLTGSVPPAATRSVADVLGRTLATPLGVGEPLTAGHLVGSGPLRGYPGRAAVAVRIPDAEVVGLLTPGQRVSLVASDPQGGNAPERVVEDAAVLAVPHASEAVGTGTLGGRLVVFAVPEARADDLAPAATSRYLSVVWTR